MRPHYFDFERYRTRSDTPCGCRELAELLRGAVGLLGVWRRRVRERGELARLDRRMLRDIGVAPHEADAECNKPFWRG
jgi:uncharacterized protein YjiS (DUF1127 family)